MSDKISSGSYTCNSRKDTIKQLNEMCYPPNNEKVYYDSIILSEIIFIEKWDSFFNSLDRLYSGLNNFDKNELKYRELLDNNKQNAFQRTIILPTILAKEVSKGERAVTQKLDPEFVGIVITLNVTLPSAIHLQIHTSLNPNISEKINDILYSTFGEKIEEFKLLDGTYTSTTSPNNIKFQKINQIKQELKTKIINFLSSYFEGSFFTLSKEDISYVPSIDLFSINYPLELEETRQWLADNSHFLQCLDIPTSIYPLYKFNNYIFAINAYTYNLYSNYSLLANRKNANADNGYSDIKHFIQYPLMSEITFELIGFDRWVEVEKRKGTSHQLLISNELEHINKNEFDQVISNRELIIKYIFNFERFKVEFQKFVMTSTRKYHDFRELNEPHNYLFDDQINKMINSNIKYIESYVSILNKHSSSNLALKNIYYNKKIQKSVKNLTIFIIILTVIQVILILSQIDTITSLVSGMARQLLTYYLP
ncbi:hypothetical protein [Methanococcoides seepicolus]|uniref:Uncharacterized protein n=1 Tax=Methanococcoides seepicolus TaxID=2828780 RepID=A0A9E4ZCI4_9EURY|nr:hypothetical protein [Methanococcoides seepicolus]MCM1985815.1 hypothetical protein [Methanococcoides seepicolus]